MINITRHENRKLYVPSVSRYTNLKEIKKLIQDGEDIQVTDHTGADVTDEITTKVLELTKNVPVAELVRLIRKGN